METKWLKILDNVFIFLLHFLKKSMNLHEILLMYTT